VQQRIHHAEVESGLPAGVRYPLRVIEEINKVLYEVHGFSGNTEDYCECWQGGVLLLEMLLGMDVGFVVLQCVVVTQCISTVQLNMYKLADPAVAAM
jgi:hypothetical protein